MQANPEVALSHHYVRKMLPDGTPQEVRHEGRLPTTGLIARELLHHCFISTSAVMVKPEAWLAAQTREASLHIARQQEHNCLPDAFALRHARQPHPASG